MKRTSIYALLVLSIIGGSVLFSKKVLAESVIADNYNIINNVCWKSGNDGGELTCGDTGNTGGGNNLWLAQELNLPLNGSGLPPFEISRVLLYGKMSTCSNNGTAAVLTGYLLNSSQFSTLRANNTIPDAIATSTPITMPTYCGTLPIPLNFDFSPNVQDASASVFVMKETTNGFMTHFALASDSTFGNGGGFTFLFDGYAHDDFHNGQPLSNDLDLMMTIYRETDVLSIDNPSHLEIINPPFSITGGCAEDLHLAIHSSSTIELSNEVAYTNPSCNTNSWQQVVPGLSHNGLWYLTATSTNDTLALRTFYYFDEDLPDANVPQPFLNWHCPIPFFDNYDFCFNIAKSIDDTLQEQKDWITSQFFKLKSLKPYGYVPQIYEAFTDGVNNASSTSTLPLATFVINSSTSPFFTANMIMFQPSMLTSILSKSVWDTIRPYAQMILWLIFINYVWRRFLYS